MNHASDMELVREYARQDSQPAFAELVRRHVNLVYSAAMRHVGASAADEITQAVFVILARKAAGLRNDTLVAAWLYETTRLTALTSLRAERRRQFREQEAYVQSTLQESMDDPIWRQIAPVLDEAMSRLGRKEREALVLRFFQDKSLRETAAGLNISEAAAQKRVSRALEKLRRHFGRHGFSSGTAAIAGVIAANSVQAAPAGLAKAVTATAVVKGAAASVSTLNLIQGALNFMAWTKAKAAILVGVAVVLAAGTTVVIQQSVSKSYEDLFLHMDSAHLKKAPPVLMLRPTHYPGRGNVSIGGGADTPGKFVGRGRPIEYLLCDAYGISPERMILPPGLPAGAFDFLATRSKDPKAGLRELIQKQLGLTAEVETREEDVLVLKVAPDGVSGLKVSQSAETAVLSDPGRFMVTNCKISSLDGTLSVVDCLGLLFGQPMIDETQLTNFYDLELQWSGNFDVPKSADQKKLVENVLRQQGGLELVRDRRQVEMLIVGKTR